MLTLQGDQIYLFFQIDTPQWWYKWIKNTVDQSKQATNHNYYHHNILFILRYCKYFQRYWQAESWYWQCKWYPHFHQKIHFHYPNHHLPNHSFPEKCEPINRSPKHKKQKPNRLMFSFLSKGNKIDDSIKQTLIILLYSVGCSDFKLYNSVM